MDEKMTSSRDSDFPNCGEEFAEGRTSHPENKSCFSETDSMFGNCIVHSSPSIRWLVPGKGKAS